MLLLFLTKAKSIFQAVLLQIDERHEVDWDAVKQVDIVTIGDDGDVNMVVTMKFQQKLKVLDRWPNFK